MTIFSMLPAKRFTSQSRLIAKQKKRTTGYIKIYGAFFSFWEKTILSTCTIQKLYEHCAALDCFIFYGWRSSESLQVLDITKTHVFQGRPTFELNIYSENKVTFIIKGLPKKNILMCGQNLWKFHEDYSMYVFTATFFLQVWFFKRGLFFGGPFMCSVFFDWWENQPGQRPVHRLWKWGPFIDWNQLTYCR